MPPWGEPHVPVPKGLDPSMLIPERPVGWEPERPDDTKFAPEKRSPKISYMNGASAPNDTPTDLVFTVTLTTTASQAGLTRVAERFERELKLQFGSAVHVQPDTITDELLRQGEDTHDSTDPDRQSGS
jgi:hypothetical protein